MPQIYSQIYINFDPFKTELANTPYAFNYSSPILHNAIISGLKPATKCALSTPSFSHLDPVIEHGSSVARRYSCCLCTC